MSLRGPVLARLYGALVYVSSLALIFFAAMLTGTHARVAFIYIFLPGVLLAVLSPFIWSGSRSAMLLAFAVAVVVQFLIVGSDPLNWWLFLAMPGVFGALTVVALLATSRSASGGTVHGVADEVFAAVVYFSGVLAVFMAPFNHSRDFGWPGFALYAAVVGLLAGGLSALIWRGTIWAMIATFVLSLLHWLALAWIDSSLWRSVPHIAAPAVSGILTVVCIAAAAKAGRATPVQRGDEQSAAVETPPGLR